MLSVEGVVKDRFDSGHAGEFCYQVEIGQTSPSYCGNAVCACSKNFNFFSTQKKAQPLHLTSSVLFEPGERVLVKLGSGVFWGFLGLFYALPLFVVCVASLLSFWWKLSASFAIGFVVLSVVLYFVGLLFSSKFRNIERKVVMTKFLIASNKI